MLKGPSGNMMGLKAGNSQTGALQTKWAGERPPGYTPMKKQRRDHPRYGRRREQQRRGNVLRRGHHQRQPAGRDDDAVQANIVAAGYGK